jgi:putative oxidoreductase
MHLIQSLVGFVGRALLSITFISSGIHKIFDWQGTLGYFTQTLNSWLALNVGNPSLQNLIEFGLGHASLLLALATCLEVIGGILVFLGLWVRLGALMLIVFLVPASLVFHHFWQLQQPERQMQMINFMKNVSILGGLFLVLAFGKGCKSGKSEKPREKEK